MKRLLLVVLILTAFAFTASASSLTTHQYGTDDAFITNSGNGTVFQWNITTDTLTRSITVGTTPNAVAVNNAGTTAYVSNSGSKTVSAINANTGAVSTINIGATPYGIAVTPDGSKVYVACMDANNVTVIWASNNTIKTNISCETARDVEITHDGKYLYIVQYWSTGQAQKYYVDNETHITDTSENLGKGPIGIAITPDDSKIYFTNYIGNTTTSIWSANNSIAGTWTNPISSPSMFGIAILPSGDRVYICDRGDDKLHVLWTANDTEQTAIIPSTYTPYGVSATPDGNYVYATMYDSNAIIKIATTNNTVVKTFYGFNKPTSLGIFARQTLVPTANFTANITSGTAPLSVQFNEHSIGNPNNWTWNFGDGLGTYAQNPVHTYTELGNYTVSLNSSNVAGYSVDTQTDMITITPDVIIPVVDFSANTTSGIAPLCVQFTDNSDNSPTEWAWEFGDNVNSTEQNPIHTYTDIGNYTVNLTVANSAGNNTTSKIDYIIVSQTVISPIANFTANQTEGITPLDVQFTDLSLNNVSNWLWNFGDNVTSIDQSPYHRYNESGNFTVSLVVNNSVGNDTMNKVSYINVTEIDAPPVAQFMANRTQMWSPEDSPFAVQFNDTSLHNHTTWQWNFGDGQGSTEQNPVHTYTSIGNYTVSLHITRNSYTSDAVLTNYINISSTPVNVSWTSDRDSYYAPASVQFNDTTMNYSGSYLWDFGDDTNSTEQNPVHLYENDSVYNVTLTLVRDGINYTSSKPIAVNYVTAGSILLSATAADQLANVNVSNNTILRLNQTSKQSAMYKAGQAVTGGIKSGFSLIDIAFTILAAIGLFLVLGWFGKKDNW